MNAAVQGNRAAIPGWRAKVLGLLLPSRSYFFALLVVALVVLAGAHDRFRDAVLDARFLVVKRAPSGNIVLVEIDPRSITAIGRWPWPRSLHAELVGKLAELGVTDIAFDVDFSARSVDAQDRRFSEALKEAGGSVILPVFRQVASDTGGARQGFLNRPLAMFEADAWLGMVNVAPDRDGVARNFTFGATIDGQFIPSIAALLAGLHEPRAPEFRIDFGIDGGAVRGVSYIDVLRGNGDLRPVLHGKKVIIAGTAAELGDRFVVPGGQIIPGALLQALAAESMLQGRALRTTTLAFSIALLIIPLCVAFVLRRRRARRRILAVILASIAAEAGVIAIQFAYPIAIDTSLLHVATAAYAFIGLIEEVDLRGLLRLAAEKRFNNVAMSLSDGLVCVDGDGRISMSNAAASRIFGFDAAQIRSLKFAQLLADPPKGRNTFAPLLTANGQVREEAGKRADGEVFPLECSWSVWETPSGRQYGVVLRDISERRRQQERIRYLAETDPVSDLPNGNSLFAALSDALRRGEPQRLMLASLWQFRRIRNLEGQTFADALIRAAAARLRSTIGQGMFISRSDSDEFAILIPAAQAENLAATLIATFRNEPLEAKGRAVRVPVVLGHAGSEDVSDPDTWLGNARFALASAQRDETESAVGFAPAMRDEVEKRTDLENRLRQALALGEFELFYQPQVDLQSRSIVGAEALIRWHHPERGYVSPGEFMPVVNASSLADGVSAWVLETAIRQAAVWQSRGTPVRVGINLAQSQFTAGTLAADVARLLEANRLDPAWVELEVTEDIILDDVSRVRAILGALRALGVHIAFDDFGTGYGSLTSLRDFPLDTIKVDQTFVRSLEPDSENAAIVAATIELGKALGKSIIAEGIETEAVAKLLHGLGCREGQGYLFGRPMPAHELEKAWLRCAA